MAGASPMRIVDRYVWKEILVPFLLGLFLFTFLLLVDKIFDLTDLIINKGVPFNLVATLLFYFLPAILVLTIPMAFLLGILVAFGRLSADMEVVAFKASGVSPLRLFRPVLVFGALIAAVTAALMIEALPRSNYAFKSLIFEIFRRQAAVGIKERVFNDDFQNFVIYVEEIAPDQIGLRHVLVADERKPDQFRVVTAREGRLLSDEQNRRVTLRLIDGTVHETTPQSLRTYRQIGFRTYDLTLSLDNPLARDAEAPKGDREMTLVELRQSALRAAESGASPNPYRVEIHKKYAIPAACLVFAIVGVPLGIRTHRAGRWAAFVAVLPIVLFYYVFLSVGETLGDRGRIPPWLAMWGPNLVVGAVGCYLLWASVQERPLPLRPLVHALGARALRAAARLKPRPPRRVATVRRRRPAVPRTAPRNTVSAFSIVDRYLTREFLTLFAYGLALTTVVVIVADLMTTLERYLRMKPPLVYVLQHFLYRTPPFVYQALHIIILMTTILLVLGLSRTNELTALKASGVSLYRVSLPIFGVVGLVTLGALGFQEIALPALNQRAVEVDETKIKRRAMPQLRKRSQIWYRSREGEGRNSRIYHIDLLDPKLVEMKGVVLLELTPDFGLKQRWDARAMRWRESDQLWELQQAVSRRFLPDRTDEVRTFADTTLRLPERFADFAQVPKAPDVMNYAELREYIGRLQQGGHQVGKYLVDLYAKMSFLFAHLIMALVGIPFALQSPRAGRMIGIALCLALGLAYFLVHSAAMALARTEVLPPVVAAWTANGLFGTLGLFFFLRART
jgi:LPS export ABC transporter permease LptF/LPS export ABC transporter permease LptG